MAKKLDDDKKVLPEQTTAKLEKNAPQTSDFGRRFEQYFKSLSKMPPLLLKDGNTIQQHQLRVEPLQTSLPYSYETLMSLLGNNYFYPYIYAKKVNIHCA